MNGTNKENLFPERLQQLIAAKQKAKAAKRRSYSLRLMKNYVGLYDCMDCIHGLTGSCPGDLPNGCEYFYNAISGRSFPIETVKKSRQKTSKRKKRLYGKKTKKTLWS